MHTQMSRCVILSNFVGLALQTHSRVPGAQPLPRRAHLLQALWGLSPVASVACWSWASSSCDSEALPVPSVSYRICWDRPFLITASYPSPASHHSRTDVAVKPLHTEFYTKQAKQQLQWQVLYLA